MKLHQTSTLPSSDRRFDGSSAPSHSARLPQKLTADFGRYTKKNMPPVLGSRILCYEAPPRDAKKNLPNLEDKTQPPIFCGKKKPHKSAKNDPMNHEEDEVAWRYNRRWLSTIFVIWFLLAFALLINSIYY